MLESQKREYMCSQTPGATGQHPPESGRLDPGVAPPSHPRQLLIGQKQLPAYRLSFACAGGSQFRALHTLNLRSARATHPSC